MSQQEFNSLDHISIIDENQKNNSIVNNNITQNPNTNSNINATTIPVQRKDSNKSNNEYNLDNVNVTNTNNPVKFREYISRTPDNSNKNIKKGTNIPSSSPVSVKLMQSNSAINVNNIDEGIMFNYDLSGLNLNYDYSINMNSMTSNRTLNANNNDNNIENIEQTLIKISSQPILNSNMNVEPKSYDINPLKVSNSNSMKELKLDINNYNNSINEEQRPKLNASTNNTNNLTSINTLNINNRIDHDERQNRTERINHNNTAQNNIQSYNNYTNNLLNFDGKLLN